MSQLILSWFADSKGIELIREEMMQRQIGRVCDRMGRIERVVQGTKRECEFYEVNWY